MPQRSYTMQEILSGALDQSQQAQRSYSIQEILNGALEKPAQQVPQGQWPNIPPSLLDSRRAATKSTLDANMPYQPPQTIGQAILQEMKGGLQAVAGLPVNTTNAVLGGLESARSAADPYG